MIRYVFLGIVLGVVLAAVTRAAPTVLFGATHSLVDSARAPTYGYANAPRASVDFCRREPGQCRRDRRPRAGERVWLGAALWQQLQTVNREVNREIEPITDLELYGRAEYWTIPTTKGDCEDVALLKRKRLLGLGWSAGVVLIAIGRDHLDEGHAVLMIMAMQGDFVLDSKRDEVILWHLSGYNFVGRQSRHDPRLWVALEMEGRS